MPGYERVAEVSRGVFVTVEGGEGVGKSTSMAFIETLLARQGIEVELTREPGGTPLAETIRDVVLTERDEPLGVETEVLLMFAARAVHVENRIRPALASGKWVVCDRFTDASFAYQGAGRGVDSAWLNSLAERVHGDLWPDCTLLLDAPVAVGRQRISRRGSPDRIEQEQTEFFERVRQAYLDRAAAEPARFTVIDASQSLAQVQEDIATALNTFLAGGNA